MDQNIANVNMSLVGRQVGLLSQHSTIIDFLTVEENLHFMARIKGLTDKEFKNNKKCLLQQLEMTEYLTVLAKDLSVGNKRKLSFAMSLLVTPAVELLDDPLSGVDPCARRGMIKVI